MQRLTQKLESASIALFVDGDLEAVERFFTPDYVVHLTERELLGGHDTVRQAVTMYRRAFREIRVEVEILVETKERIAWQRTFHAKHEASFKGFPGTRRLIAWRDMVVTRFDEGLIAEEWLMTDLAERLLTERKR